MSLEEKDKRNRRVGAIVSIGIHGLVVLLFFFLIAWRAPNPPLPEFGIELNFGLDDTGSGEVQPESVAAITTEDQDAAPDAPEEITEEQMEEVNEVTEQEIEDDLEPQEEVQKESTDDTNPTNEDALTQEVTNQDSPDVVETSEAQKKVEEIKPTPKLPPVLYPGKKDGANGKEGDASQAAEANQGDDIDKAGDKGDPDGEMDARALYGKPGGGGGTALEMAGWIWDKMPNPEEKTSESGKIIFSISIDDRGEIISVKPLQYTVSVSLMKIYQAEVEKLTFRKTSSSAAPLQSSGKITFIIKAR